MHTNTKKFIYWIITIMMLVPFAIGIAEVLTAGKRISAAIYIIGFLIFFARDFIVIMKKRS